jgi:hypothetical protein
MAIRVQTGASAFYARLLVRPMRSAEAWGLIEPIRCALQRILDETAEIGLEGTDFGLVGIALNQTWMRLRDLGGRHDDMAVIEQAVRALERVLGADGDMTPELHEALCEGINLFDRTLRASPLADWADTERQLRKTVMSGQKVIA